MFIESLDRLKTKLEEQSEKVEKESYYLFYRPDFFSVNKEKIFYFETKEALALYYIRLGDREQAEKLVNRYIGAKIDLYMTFYYGDQGGEFILRSLAYSYYRLGYITGHKDPMTRAAEVLISPAWMDCHPALSARIPVSSAVDFFAASKPP